MQIIQAKDIPLLRREDRSATYNLSGKINICVFSAQIVYDLNIQCRLRVRRETSSCTLWTILYPMILQGEQGARDRNSLKKMRTSVWGQRVVKCKIVVIIQPYYE